MEAVVLLLIGAVLFSHSWYLLGLFTEGRGMGVIAMALGLGLLGVAVGVFEPLSMPDLVGGTANPAIVTVQTYALLWAGYTFAVAAHGVWDFDERPIGFYSLFLVVATLVYIIGLAAGGLGKENLPSDVGIGIAAGSLAILTILMSAVFVYLAVPIRSLRLVAGWFMLVGSAVVSLAGFLVLFDMVGL